MDTLRPVRTTTRTTLIAAMALLSTGLAITTPRAAADVHSGDRVRVCDAKLELNRKPNAGREGVLHKRDSLRVRRQSPSGKYTRGFAYGHVNRVGWVRSDGLCLDGSLSGPSQLRVLQGLTYRATGLPAGSYALLIERRIDGAKCSAHLAARRSANGTELFRGSLPDGLQCVRGDDHKSMATEPGSYRVLVRDDRGDDPAVASKSVRVVD